MGAFEETVEQRKQPHIFAGKGTSCYICGHPRGGAIHKIQPDTLVRSKDAMTCPACNGKGRLRSTGGKCDACGGTGKMTASGAGKASLKLCEPGTPSGWGENYRTANDAGGRRARLHRALDKVMDRAGARDGNGLEQELTILANSIRNGRIDLAVLGLSEAQADRLADSILHGRIDQAVLAEKLAARGLARFKQFV